MTALTGAQKQKRYADKLKTELGEEEYKKLMKIKNKVFTCFQLKPTL